MLSILILTLTVATATLSAEEIYELKIVAKTEKNQTIMDIPVSIDGTLYRTDINGTVRLLVNPGLHFIIIEPKPKNVYVVSTTALGNIVYRVNCTFVKYVEYNHTYPDIVLNITRNVTLTVTYHVEKAVTYRIPPLTQVSPEKRYFVVRTEWVEVIVEPDQYWLWHHCREKDPYYGCVCAYWLDIYFTDIYGNPIKVPVITYRGIEHLGELHFKDAAVCGYKTCPVSGFSFYIAKKFISSDGQRIYFINKSVIKIRIATCYNTITIKYDLTINKYLFRYMDIVNITSVKINPLAPVEMKRWGFYSNVCRAFNIWLKHYNPEILTITHYKLFSKRCGKYFIFVTDKFRPVWYDKSSIPEYIVFPVNRFRIECKIHNGHMLYSVIMNVLYSNVTPVSITYSKYVHFRGPPDGYCEDWVCTFFAVIKGTFPYYGTPAYILEDVAFPFLVIINASRLGKAIICFRHGLPYCTVSWWYTPRGDAHYFEFYIKDIHNLTFMVAPSPICIVDSLSKLKYELCDFDHANSKVAQVGASGFYSYAIIDKFMPLDEDTFRVVKTIYLYTVPIIVLRDEYNNELQEKVNITLITDFGENYTGTHYLRFSPGLVKSDQSMYVLATVVGVPILNATLPLPGESLYSIYTLNTSSRTVHDYNNNVRVINYWYDLNISVVGVEDYAKTLIRIYEPPKNIIKCLVIYYSKKPTGIDVEANVRDIVWEWKGNYLRICFVVNSPEVLKINITDMYMLRLVLKDTLNNTLKIIEKLVPAGTNVVSVNESFNNFTFKAWSDGYLETSKKLFIKNDTELIIIYKVPAKIVATAILDVLNKTHNTLSISGKLIDYYGNGIGNRELTIKIINASVIEKKVKTDSYGVFELKIPVIKDKKPIVIIEFLGDPVYTSARLELESKPSLALLLGVWLIILIIIIICIVVAVVIYMLIRRKGKESVSLRIKS